MKHKIKPKAYLRYGDDFIVVASDLDWLERQRVIITGFLQKELGLATNKKNNIIVKAKQGIHFLGLEIFPSGRRLKKQNWHRATNRLSLQSYSSYYGLVKQHCNEKKRQCLDWVIGGMISP